VLDFPAWVFLSRIPCQAHVSRICRISRAFFDGIRAIRLIRVIRGENTWFFGLLDSHERSVFLPVVFQLFFLFLLFLLAFFAPFFQFLLQLLLVLLELFSFLFLLLLHLLSFLLALFAFLFLLGPLCFFLFDHPGFLLVTAGCPHARRSDLSVIPLIVHPAGGCEEEE
jgi:hypothetical protein